MHVWRASMHLHSDDMNTELHGMNYNVNLALITE